MKPHPETIEKSGENRCIAPPFQKYETLTEIIGHYEDLMDLRREKNNARGQKGIPLEQAIAELKIPGTR